MPVKPAPSIRPGDFLRTRSSSKTIEFTFRLITPMFGGGVEVNGPQKPHDPVTPIRIPSIRGQLRFWWRACNPAKATTHKELFKAEEALWGSTTSPSKVQFSLATRVAGGKPVDIYRRKDPRPEDPPGKLPAFEVRREQQTIAYGVFPLKPDEASEDPPGQLFDLAQTELTLVLCCDSAFVDQVSTALIAWSLFGGLGARTRRGFGAVECREHTSDSIDSFLDSMQRDQPDLQPQGVPSLCQAQYRLGQAYPSPRVAWENALMSLARFRQHRRKGSQTNRPGRSFWPEPEQIRALTVRDPRHQVLPDPIPSYPRAAFGLPIMFHFQSKKDPPDTQLNPIDLNRFASPLLIRALRDKDGLYRPLALVLEGTKVPDNLVLSAKNQQTRHLVTRALTKDQAERVPRLQDNPDPLGAFLHYFATFKP